MSKEASWIATMLAVLLIVMALLSPQAEGRLPTLEEMEKMYTRYESTVRSTSPPWPPAILQTQAEIGAPGRNT